MINRKKKFFTFPKWLILVRQEIQKLYLVQLFPVLPGGVLKHQTYTHLSFP